jgi:hypothetical protein
MLRLAPPVRKLAGVICAALALVACEEKGTLENSRAELIKVEGRRYEVRVASTGVENEYRLLVVRDVRDTLVIDPDPELEHSRASNVARVIMARSCKSRPYQVLEDRLVSAVNYYTRFRCGSSS